MPQVVSPLFGILQEARDLLAMPGNVFSWSKWPDAETAVAELEEHMSHVDEGRTLERFRLNQLFAPTGSIQEVSMSSGWSRQFIELATRFDEVMGN